MVPTDIRVYLLESFIFSPVCFGQRNTASLGTGPSKQEDQAHRVSDQQAEENCEMFRGTVPFSICACVVTFWHISVEY